MNTNNPIRDLSFLFAVSVVEFSELLEEKRKFVIARQLLKSGTSIGANVREAQSAESKDDFIHKLKISSKEAEETEYWLEICKACRTYPYEPILMEKLIEIKKLLNAIISSSKKRN